MLRPGDPDRSQLVRKDLRLQHGEHARVNHEGDPRTGMVKPQVPQEWQKDYNVAQIPVFEREDLVDFLQCARSGQGLKNRRSPTRANSNLSATQITRLFRGLILTELPRGASSVLNDGLVVESGNQHLFWLRSPQEQQPPLEIRGRERPI